VIDILGKQYNGHEHPWQTVQWGLTALINGVTVMNNVGKV
jgi:hypothetical protein